LRYKQGKRYLYNSEDRIMKLEKKELIKEEEKALLTFLRQTKEGKYAKIDKSSMPYVRLKEQRAEFY